MMTQKTINIAFVVALIASVASVSAMDDANAGIWATVKTKAAKAAEYVVGKNKEDNQNGLPVIKPAYDFLVRTYPRYTLGVAALATAAGAYAGYNYYTAEEPKKEATKPLQKKEAPKVEAPKIEAPKIEAPKVEDKVEAPKAEDKKEDKASKKKIGARRMRRAEKSFTSNLKKAKADKAGEDKVAKDKKAKRSFTGNCKNGNCNVRRSK